MKSLLVTVGLAVLLLLASTVTSQPATRELPKIRVGVYDSRAVCIASRNSPTMQSQIAELQKQLKQAQAAGDAPKAEAIKRRGEALQQLRHAQAFSNAPVDELLEPIHDKLPQIARDADVDVIANHYGYQSDRVEVVDITAKLVNALHPDEKTRKVIAELLKKPPIKLLDALAIDD